MDRYFFKLLLASTIVLASVATAFGQPDQDIAHWLDRDETLLIDVQDVPTSYEKIKSLDLFSNPRFIKAITMLSDERFPVVNRESFEKILVRLNEMEALIRKINQISFVIHDIDENDFRWSLFIRAESEVLDKLQFEMRGIETELEKESPSVDVETEANDTEISAVMNEESEAIRWGEFHRVGQWLVLSNQSSFLEALTDRVGNDDFRSLAKSRKYRAINKRKSPLNDQHGLITIYGNPVRMRYMFPYATQNEWDLLEIDELPACGLNIVVTDSDSEDQPQPIVLADAVVKFTKPTVGQAKILEHYRAIEIPPLAAKPIELLAFARDEKAVAQESIRIYDQHHGANAADIFWRNHFAKPGIDYENDAIPRREAFFEMRFIDDDHTFDRPGLVGLEKLADKQAALRYAGKVVDHANKRYKRTLTIQEDGSEIWWTMPSEKFDGNSGLDGFDRKLHARNDFFNCRHDAYVMTDQWWVQGDMPVVKDQVRLLTTGEGEDHAQSIRDLIEDLTRRLHVDDPPVMIKYYTTDSWQENLNNIERQYANSNSIPITYRITGTGDNGQTFQFLLEVVSENKGGTIEIQPGVQFGSLGNIKVIRAMPLTERNEDGHRIPLKRREDLETAIRVMILKSLSETFPRQLFLYTRNEHHIRIMMGAYPAEDLIEGND